MADCRSGARAAAHRASAWGGRIIKVRRACVGIALHGLEAPATERSESDERETCRANEVRECVTARWASPAQRPLAEGWRSSGGTLSVPDTSTAPTGVRGSSAAELTGTQWSEDVCRRARSEQSSLPVKALNPASQTNDEMARAGGLECRRLLPLWVGGTWLTGWPRRVMQEEAQQTGIDGSE